MHEAAIHDRFILEDNLVAVAAFEALLITVAFMVAVLDLLEIPYDAEFADSRHKVLFLLPVFCYLMESMDKEECALE